MLAAHDAVTIDYQQFVDGTRRGRTEPPGSALTQAFACNYLVEASGHVLKVEFAACACRSLPQCLTRSSQLHSSAQQRIALGINELAKKSAIR